MRRGVNEDPDDRQEASRLHIGSCLVETRGLFLGSALPGLPVQGLLRNQLTMVKGGMESAQ